MKIDCNNSKNIALIDDDLTLYSEIEEQKNYNKNYYWHHLKNLTDLNQFIRQKSLDLIIYNEEEFGAENIKQFSSTLIGLPDIPVIVLSSKKEFKEMGNYLDEKNELILIKKPFKFGILFEILRDKFKSQDVSRSTNIKIGPYLFKPFEKIVIDPFEEKLLLTDTEVKILKVLCNYEGGYVKKEKVLQEVWGIKYFLNTHTLETHIYRLRKKMLTKFNGNLSIKSKPGSYSFDCKY